MGNYNFAYWQVIDDAAVVAVMCQNLYTRAHMYNKNEVI